MPAKTTRRLAVLVALACWAQPGPVRAFNMDPVARPRGILWVPKALLDKVKEPVHEIMTVLAYDCHQDPSKCAGKEVAWKRTNLKQKLGRLLDGVEWNDDPTLKLHGGLSAVKWAVFMGDADKIARCRRLARPGQTCKAIDASYDLLYRSHYGDLQFVHAMASTPDEPADVTRAKVLLWAEYTYKLAIGVIAPDRPLSEIAEVDVDAYLQRGSWTSRLLFTRDKPDMRNDTPKVALGSLLHMVQDSFSDAHAHRQLSCNKLAIRKGAIEEFHIYSLQAAAEHAKADVMPDWLAASALGEGNPVTASAWLIRFALEGKAWEEVRGWLTDNVFALSNQARPSGPGEPRCFEGD